MELTEKDKKRVLEWVQKKCGSMRCTCCGMGQWELAPNSSVVLGFNVHTTRFHYHEGIPVISIVCANCGHLVLFAAGVLGFKPDPPAASDAPRT